MVVRVREMDVTGGFPSMSSKMKSTCRSIKRVSVTIRTQAKSQPRDKVTSSTASRGHGVTTLSSTPSKRTGKKVGSGERLEFTQTYQLSVLGGS